MEDVEKKKGDKGMKFRERDIQFFIICSVSECNTFSLCNNPFQVVCYGNVSNKYYEITPSFIITSISSCSG